MFKQAESWFKVHNDISCRTSHPPQIKNGSIAVGFFRASGYTAQCRCHGGDGDIAISLLFTPGLGPLRHPCLCCGNHWPADTSHPLGLKDVLSECSRNYYPRSAVGRINHWQEPPPQMHRCGYAHSLLSNYTQICLVTVPLASPRQFKWCCVQAATQFSTEECMAHTCFFCFFSPYRACS